MPLITFVQSDGRRDEIEVFAGLTLMSAATTRSIDGIVGECGGNAMCATCHIYVEPDWLDVLPPLGDDEDALLDGAASERLSNSRLACQITVTPDLDGLVVRMPATQV